MAEYTWTLKTRIAHDSSHIMRSNYYDDYQAVHRYEMNKKITDVVVTKILIGLRCCPLSFLPHGFGHSTSYRPHNGSSQYKLPRKEERGKKLPSATWINLAKISLPYPYL